MCTPSNSVFFRGAAKLLLFSLSTQLAAAPSGADLLRACETALRNEFSGIEGQMCVWYATPCECDLAAEPELPRVCLPESSTERARAEQIITAIRKDPALQQDSALRAASIVLARSYRCDD